MSGRRAAGTAAMALALGAVTEVAVVMVALVEAPRIIKASEVMLIRGTTAWHGNDRSSALLRWINMETIGPLVNQGGDSGAVPAWAEPPAAADARLVRHAALAAGWPLPAIACSWTTDRLDVNFPPPIENETSGDAPKEAARRSIAALRHERAPTGGHGAMRILPGGFAAGAVAFAFPWCAVVSLARIAIERRRGVTPRE